MNRTIPLVLLLLLVGASGLAVYEYNEKQRLQTERDELRSQLDETAAKLRQAEQEQARLQAELNQTQAQVTQLEGKITELEANITALRQEMQLQQNAVVTIGLTWLWTPPLNKRFEDFTTTKMKDMIRSLNKVWEYVHVYFFIYHNAVWQVSDKQIAELASYNSGQGCPTWVFDSRGKYKGNDIPIIVVPLLGGGEFGKYAGLCCGTGEGGPIALPGSIVGEPNVNVGVLSHELLHAFGYKSESEIASVLVGDTSFFVGPIVILGSAASRIVAAALRFQMALPSSS